MLLPMMALLFLTSCIVTLGFLLLLIDPTTKLSLLNLAIFTFVGMLAWLGFMNIVGRLAMVFPSFQHYSNLMLVAHISTIAISGRLAVFAVQCLKFAKADPGTGFSPATNPREI